MARRVTPAAASWLSRGTAIVALLVAMASSSSALLTLVMLQVVGLAAAALVVSRWMPRLHIFAIGAAVFVLLRTPTAWAPVVIALLLVAAGLQLASDRGRDVTLEQLKPTWIAVVVTGLIATLLAGRMLGPFNGSPGTDSLPERPLEDMKPAEDGSNFLAELLGRGVSAVARWVGAGSEQVSGGSFQPPEPERDINWTRLLLVMAIVLVVMLLLWWAWHRWRRRPSEESTHGDWAVRSLDDTGRRVARERLVSEDPASYGGQIELPTSNGRLARAGLLVSDRLYRPADRAQTADEEAVLRSELEGLADLPSAPTPPRRRPTTKQFAIAGAVFLLLGFGAFALWRGSSGDRDEPTTESMLTAPATGADGYRWVLCAVELGDGPPQYAAESRGFVDRSSPLAASEVFLPSRGRIFVDDGGALCSALGSGIVTQTGPWCRTGSSSEQLT